MDTRNKILTLAGARELQRPITVVATAVNVLRGEFVSQLAALRTPGRTLLAMVLPCEPELLPARARAELLAGLRDIDYVTIAGDCDLDGFDVVHLEQDDARRTAELMEKVRAAAK